MTKEEVMQAIKDLSHRILDSHPDLPGWVVDVTDALSAAQDVIEFPTS